MNKKLIFISLIIILITCTSTITATDTNHTQSTDTNTITATDTDNIQTTQIQETTQKPTKTINKTTQKNTKQATTSVTNYEQLYNNLTNPEAEQDLTITLINNPMVSSDPLATPYRINRPITLSESIKNLVIEGNNVTISGQGQYARYQFLIVNHDTNITINNVTITLCSASSPGSAIYQNGGSLILNNTQFTENIIAEIGANEESYGGAIATNATELTIENSYFAYNRVEPYYLVDCFGGAVSFNGQNKTNINVINSTFEYNGVMQDRYYGSAIAIVKPNNTNIIDSYFGFNWGYDGVAIFYDSYINDTIFNIQNTTFENNTCMAMNYEPDGWGGAILAYSNSQIIINNTIFQGNMVNRGGAVRIFGSSKNNIDIINSTFDSNGIFFEEVFDSHTPYILEYSEDAGALFIDSLGNTTIYNSTFKNNKAIKSGGAIVYTGGTESVLKIQNSLFDSNGFEETSNGGAISITDYGTTIIDNVEFINNTANNSGAVYYITGNENLSTKLIINNTLFKSNGQENITNAGALTIDESGNTSITNTKFISNTGELGAAYILYPGELLIENTTFDSNTAKTNNEEAQATAGGLTLITNANTTIKNTTYTNNNGTDGGAVDYLGLYDSNLKIIDSTFKSNQDQYIGYRQGMGGAINMESFGNISIENTTFKDNSAAAGGAIAYVSYGDNILEIRDSTFDSNGIKDLSSYEELYPVGGALILGSYEGNNKVIIDNTNFTNNIAQVAGAIYMESDAVNELIINNSKFDSNSIEFNENNYTLSALLLEYTENVIINNSVFTNHINGFAETPDIYTSYPVFLSGTIIGYMDPENNFTIDNSNFTDNKGQAGVGVTLTRGYASIENTNFENNIILDSSNVNLCGLLVNSIDTQLSIDNITVKNNGIKEELLSEYEMQSSMPLILQQGGNITINNSLFTLNKGLVEGVPVLYTASSPFGQDEIGSDPQASDIIIVNNSRFENNINYIKPLYDSIMNIAPGIVISVGNGIINNSAFISNKAIPLETGDYPIQNIGVISPLVNYLYPDLLSCNVTNCLFFDNNPANFILDGDKVIMNNLTSVGFEQQKDGYGHMSSYMDDGYIPNRANVTVYVNNNSTGTQYPLTTKYVEGHDGEIIFTYIRDFEISGLNIDNNDYLYKLVIDQTEDSIYSPGHNYDANVQSFYNNTYYFQIAENYKISVEASTPVKLGDNTTIKGRVYCTTSDEQEVVRSNCTVDIYINDTYITTTQTDNDGIYEFNYTSNIIGTQNVTVKLNQNYMPKISNNTTFEVTTRLTKLNINNTESVVGKQTNITFQLTETDNTPVKDANITVHINNEEYTFITDENGTITIPYTPESVGNNYVTATYEGNLTYMPSNNTLIFKTEQLNTTITVTATNTTVNNKTLITGKLSDETGEAIPETQITLYINDKPTQTQTGNDGIFSLEYTATIPGENYIEAYYKGNSNLASSLNTTKFIANKINTTTTATPITQKVDNTTINVKVEGQDKNKINTGIITITEDGKTIATQTITGEETIVQINDITSGPHNLTINYEGNTTYNPSNKTITVNIKQEPKINIEITNNTEGNVEAEISVTDEKGNPIEGETVTVTMPDGSKANMTTDKDGKIIVTDTNTPTGETSITATIPANNTTETATNTKQFTITPDYQKTIDKLNNTVQEQQEAIDKLNNTVQEQQEAIDKLNNTVQEQQEAIDKLNNTVQEQQDQIKNLEDTLDTLNKTSVITVVPDNGTVDDNKVVVTLNNKQGTPISNAPITIKNSKGETIGNATTDKNGVAVIPVSTKAGQENITVTYPGDSKLTPANTTVSITTTKNNVTVTVDPVNGVIGENIVLTAHIKDTKGNSVSGGNLVFKLNGKTLRSDGSFNSTASAWKFTVKDGIVTVTIKADLYLRNAKNLTASYSGSYKYNEAKSSVVTAQIRKRDAKITVTSTPKSQKQYQTIKFTAKLTDTTPGYKNTTAINTGTKVLFKINGKTLKDSKGKQVLVKVVNNTATYKYTVPQGMGGITNSGETRNYDVEAVLVSDTYYPDTRATTTFNVQRSPVTIDIAKVSVNNNKLSVKASIKDYKGNNVIGDNDINIKINGKSYVNPKTNKTQNFKVSEGNIDLSNLDLGSNIKIKTVTIVTGARQAYLGARNETTNIVKA